MMKRTLFPVYLFPLIFICLFAASPANAQDSTKKAEPEIKTEVKAPAKEVTPPKVKYHYHKLYPTTTTAAKPAVAAPPTNTTTPAKGDSASLKTQMDPSQLNAKSLNGQYQYLLTKTLRFQQPLIAALWKNVNDTLNQVRGKLKDLQSKFTSKDHLIDSLKTDANAKEQTLSQSTEKVDSISVFGIFNTSKSTYNLVMVAIVVILAIALAVVILTTARHKHEARHRTELYEEIDEEYRNFKIKANEKEKKLARELQTERNKLDELLGRG